MTPCPRCGAENPPEHKFCSSCGLSLAPAPPPAADTTQAWLGAGDPSATRSPFLDDSWMPPGATRPATPQDTPAWLSQDVTPPAPQPAPEAPVAADAPSSEELPDWLREVADESRQRIEARSQGPAPAPAEEPQPPIAPTLSSSDDLPDWLREITAEARAADTAATAGADAAPDTIAPDAGRQVATVAGDSLPWQTDDAPAADIVEGEVLAVEVETQPPASADAAALAGPGSPGGEPAAAQGLDQDAEQVHARVYDVPDDTVWSVQPDRPAADGTTGQPTAVWAAADERATEIVPQATDYALPSWLIDDDIEPVQQQAEPAWQPPSWLEDSDVDVAPVPQPSSTWQPPSWLDDDDLPPPGAATIRKIVWRDTGPGTVAMAAGGAAAATMSSPMVRPAENASAELLQNLLLQAPPEPAAADASRSGGGTMLIVIVVVLLVMAALVGVFWLPALGYNLF